jgi:hypothetical protein
MAAISATAAYRWMGAALEYWRRWPAVSGWGTYRAPSHKFSGIQVLDLLAAALDIIRRTAPERCSKRRTRHVAPEALRA